MLKERSTFHLLINRPETKVEYQLVRFLPINHGQPGHEKMQGEE